MRFLVKKAALKQMQEAFDYYELQQQSLGDRFLDELEDSFELIRLFPSANPCKFKHYRQRTLPVFPFIVLYEHQLTFIRVTGVYHTSKKREF